MDSMKMLKDFLRPTMHTVALFVFLAVIGGYFGFFVLLPRVLGNTAYGMPLPIMQVGCSAPTGNYGTDVFPCSSNLDLLAVVLDLVFWYLVACILVYCYKMMTKKGKRK